MQPSAPATVTKPVNKQRALRNQFARSKVTNGQRFFMGQVDERCIFARRLRDIMALHIDDLSGGTGASALSEAQISLIRRASVLELRLEDLEMKMAMGQIVSLDDYGRISGHLRRLFETVGVRRSRGPDVTPTLHEVVAKHQRDREAREAAALIPVEVLGPSEQARREKQRQSMLAYWARQKALRRTADDAGGASPP